MDTQRRSSQSGAAARLSVGRSPDPARPIRRERPTTARPENPGRRGSRDLEMERAKGFEPSTPTLARLCSTPELHPRSVARQRRARRVICPKSELLARGCLGSRRGIRSRAPRCRAPASLESQSSDRFPDRENRSKRPRNPEPDVSPHLTPQQLLDYLATLGIPAETVEHEPVFTVAESRHVKARIPGAHSKNLFVKDKIRAV